MPYKMALDRRKRVDKIVLRVTSAWQSPSFSCVNSYLNAKRILAGSRLICKESFGGTGSIKVSRSSIPQLSQNLRRWLPDWSIHFVSLLQDGLNP